MTALLILSILMFVVGVSMTVFFAMRQRQLVLDQARRHESSE